MTSQSLAAQPLDADLLACALTIQRAVEATLREGWNGRKGTLSYLSCTQLSQLGTTAQHLPCTNHCSQTARGNSHHK